MSILHMAIFVYMATQQEVKIKRNGFRRNKSKICRFDEKENDEENMNRKKMKVLFCLLARISEIDWELELEAKTYKSAS